jgi:LDH2 family malate/lactate/ureidoglycolate dehydrogenase
MIGMAMCNVPPIALAAGGSERVYGTNPIAFGAPIEGGPPFLLDAATTAVAGGKLEIAMRQGKKIPWGWAVDAQGNDTDDPEILRKGGALLPLGSKVATSSYKGYGLGIMVDILTGMLPGGASGLFSDRAQLEQGYWFAAWRIDAFRDPAEFRADMKRVADHIRGTKPAADTEAVLLAGDPEHAARAVRTVSGIPLDAETIHQLTTLGEEVGTPFPPAIS